MELKPGYKQTEVGVFPEDWIETTVRAFEPFVTSGSRGWARYYANHGELFVRITNMKRDSIMLDLNECRFVRLPMAGHEGSRTELMDGDILISVTADIGIVSYIDSIVPLPAYINQHIALVRFSPEDLASRFIAYFLAHGPSQRRFRAITDQGAKAGINLDTIRDIPLVLPPTESEQRAIAMALSDVDALLAGLDRLIAKKRDLKQAAMQQLLTGETRLPGFEGEWRSAKFSDLTSPSHARVNPSRSEPHEFCVELEHIDQGTGRLLGWSSTTLRSSLKAMFEPGDVLFGKLRAYLRKYWLANRPGVCSTEIWVLKPNPEYVTSAYLYQLVTMDWFIEAASTAYGTHMPRSDWKIIRESELLVPWPEEQDAITSVLGDMDAEIEALEQRRAKTADLKQAMMQELLTGKTRLITPEVAHA